MFRKVTGVICLAIGGIFIAATGMVGAVVYLRDAEMGVVITLIYAVIVTLFMLGGMALWGWQRWRILLGATLTSVGGMLAMCAISIPMVIMSPEWKKMATDPEVEEMMPSLAASSGVSGVICLAVGIALLIAQKKRDEVAAEPGLSEA